MRLVPPATRTVTRLAATCLVLEAFLVFFASLVALRLTNLSPATVWVAGGSLALACLLTAGLVRRRAGLLAGTALQALVLATAFWVPAMAVMGALFAAMWFWFLHVGARIDREQAERAAGEPGRR